MNLLYVSAAMVACYDNDNDAWIPEIWASGALMILEENMVAANLVYRDFEDKVADYGDVVNCRRPNDFKVRRKVDGTTLSQQDAKSPNVRVPLDQWFYDSFTIKDGEASKSQEELTEQYMVPCVQAVARGVDRSVLGHIHKFFGDPADRVGRLENMTKDNSKDYVLEARRILNVNKVPPNPRSLILSPASETAMLQTELFIKANERGDDGTALEEALLGRILGFNTYMGQNVNGVAVGLDTVAGGTVDDAQPAGEGGVQDVTFTGLGIVTVGEFFTVAGNDQPTFITAQTDDATDTTDVTLNEVNKFATLPNAVAVQYLACDVVNGYAAGYSEAITLDGYTTGKAPQVGQLIAFGTGSNRRTYTVVESEDAGSTCTIHLDRPLEVSLVNDQKAFPGPAGSFNWAMHREALALVTRPLALPKQGSGALSAVASYNGLSMRITMQYDINAGGTIVNVDMLAGIAVLDDRMCVPLLG